MPALKCGCLLGIKLKLLFVLQFLQESRPKIKMFNSNSYKNNVELGIYNERNDRTCRDL